jgi:hypothetical protein
MKAGDWLRRIAATALMLATLHRAGELTPIWIPDAAHEAMRDLVRARICEAFCCASVRSTEGFVPGPWLIAAG